jgi:ParB family transcriptional regulator, chromosome partitioning protein
LKVKIDQIKVKKRMRKDIGNILELRESMSKRGLINPISITRNYELLAGFRRLLAAKELGWTEIECNVISAKTKQDKFEIETEENLVRENFSTEELEAVEERREYLKIHGIQKVFYLVNKFFKWILSIFKMD